MREYTPLRETMVEPMDSSATCIDDMLRRLIAEQIEMNERLDRMESKIDNLKTRLFG